MIENGKYKRLLFSSQKRLVRIDKYGKVYIPRPIQKLYRGYRFCVMVENGKIILDPVKIDDEVIE